MLSKRRVYLFAALGLSLLIAAPNSASAAPLDFTTGSIYTANSQLRNGRVVENTGKITEAPSVNVSDASQGSFQIAGSTNAITFAYDLYDLGGNPTGYSIEARFRNPSFPKANSSYVRYFDKGGHQVDRIPGYSAKWSYGSLDLGPLVTLVVAGPEKIANADAARSLAASCNDAKCQLGKSVYKSSWLGPQSSVSEVRFNYGDTGGSKALSWTQTTAESNSIDITVTAGGTIAKLVELEVSASYGHTWSRSYSVANTDTINIPPNGVGYFTRQQAMQSLSGVLYIPYSSSVHGVSITRYRETPVINFDAPDPNGSSRLNSFTCGIVEYEAYGKCLSQPMVKLS